MTPQLLRAILRQSFYSFVQRVFREVASGETFLPNWYVEAMCFELTEVAAGRCRRMLIEVPPRSLKSICASVALPAWILGHDPTRKIICVSYAQPLASQFSAMCRQVMKSEWYRRLFPRTRISPDKDTESYFRTTAGGYRDGTSVGGTLTGKGGDLIIIDDPAKPDELMSEAQRSAVNGWYDRTLLTRLNNKSTDAIVIVMQRLHFEDLAAHVQTREKWTTLKVQAIAEEAETFRLEAGRIYKRPAGQLLDPIREPLDVLLAMKEAMGSAQFSAQYQQEPLPSDGSVVEWNWFGRYQAVPMDHHIVQSWDCASKADEFNDYSVCLTFAVCGANYYLLDIFRKRLRFPELLQAVHNQAYAWRAKEILVEDSAAGTQIVQMMRFYASTRIAVPLAMRPEKDKQTRLHAVSAVIEQGRVHLPQSAHWLEDFRVELIQFPYGRYDDQVDALSQFLGRMEQVRMRGATVQRRPMFRYK